MVTRNGPSEDAPRQRVVLLGASNLTRGISTVVDTARRVWDRPLEIFSALGHGRSFGMTSSVLGRELPGILQCGIWDALSVPSSAPAAALVTDVGNDLAYGASVDQIVSWVEQCLDRLAAAQCRTVLTELPLASLAGLSEWRFRIARSILFPSFRLSRDAVLEQAHTLNDRLARLAEVRQIPLIRPKIDWYGLDPIHIRLRHWSTAWPEIFAPWRELNAAFAPPRGSLSRWVYLRSRVPEERRLAGIVQRRAQPSGRLSDGTTIAIY